MPVRLVAVLGVGLVDPGTPIVRADDEGLTRGDGCFEGCRIRTDADGRSEVDKLDRHLARMARSAGALDIAFDAAQWQQLVTLACETWREPGEAALKLVLTRGTDRPLGFLTIAPLDDEVFRQRREGLRVATMTRGFLPAAFADAPWLLGGVKTLSYAVNQAAAREALRRGADDALFIAADGSVLETPHGTGVWSVGRTLRTIPTGDTGILGGTTVALLFDRAAEAGWAIEHVPATVDDLHAADVVWITSSVRGPIDVIALDGVARTRRPDVDAEIRQLSGFGDVFRAAQ